jgi:hypothetical protein
MPMKVVVKVIVPSGLRVGSIWPRVSPAALSDSDLPLSATNVCRTSELSRKVLSGKAVNRSTTFTEVSVLFRVYVVDLPLATRFFHGERAVPGGTAGALAFVDRPRSFRLHFSGVSSPFASRHPRRPGFLGRRNRAGRGSGAPSFTAGLAALGDCGTTERAPAGLQGQRNGKLP